MPTVYTTGDPWDHPRDAHAAAYGRPSPAESIADYGQDSALGRFVRDELRSSERDALAVLTGDAVRDALPKCRALVDAAAAEAVEAFLAAHPDARSALPTAPGSAPGAPLSSEDGTRAERPGALRDRCL